MGSLVQRLIYRKYFLLLIELIHSVRIEQGPNLSQSLIQTSLLWSQTQTQLQLRSLSVLRMGIY